MSHDDLLVHTQRLPFSPFRMILIDGQSYDIERPEMLVIGRHDVLVGNPSTTNPSFYDITQQVALRHIKHIEPLVPAEIGIA